MGEGAFMEKGVQWLKKLSRKEFIFFVESSGFINKDMWLEKIHGSLTEGSSFTLSRYA